MFDDQIALSSVAGLDVGGRCALRRSRAFTIVELLVVVAIMSLLLAMLLPGLAAARERAAVIKTIAELRQIVDALEGYGGENHGRFPPQRTYCDTEKLHHWCDLPVELVDGRWLPRPAPGTLLSTVMEDVFNPGHTYKYVAPGWGYHNNGAVLKTLWVPDDFPRDDPGADGDTLAGDVYDDVTRPIGDNGEVIRSPVSWVVYSVGPRYDENERLPKRFPVARRSWYKGFGTRGVIPWIKDRDGFQLCWQ